MQQDVIVGCNYNELNMNTSLLNLASLGSSLVVSIPVEFCKYKLCEIYDISTGSPREVNFFGKIQQDRYHPWLDIPFGILNLHSGKHVYKFVFLDLLTSKTHQLFISYTIQDDNPETPYVYMGNRGNTSDNSWKDGSYADSFYNEMRKSVQETYGYDPLLFAESENRTPYCQSCLLPSCENCPYKEA